VSAELGERIVRHIRAEGPLPLSAYMAIALHDPLLGYYARREPIGRAGDFVTGPEISQILGELIGLWCADLWQKVGSPNPVMLAELGPGHGTLAIDLLRAVGAAAPGFRRALRLYLVETSPVLREAQRRQLAFAAPIWFERVEDLPDGPLLVVANEFLDALPVRQLVRGRTHWAERVVALDRADRLVFAAGPQNPALDLLVPERLRDGAAPGTIFEICPAALALADTLGARFARQPGAALFVDYGNVENDSGPSLRAVSHHRAVPPLDMPGEADLSADVDFAAFGETAHAAGAAIYGPVTQAKFLRALGAAARLAVLCQRATPPQRQRLQSGFARLLDPGEMGTLFKALALASPGLPAPEGFASDPA